MDAEGIELRAVLKATCLEIVTVLTTAADAGAGAEVDARLLPDVLAATSVVDAFHLPAPRRCARAVIRVDREDGAVAARRPESEQRRIVRRDATSGAL